MVLVDGTGSINDDFRGKVVDRRRIVFKIDFTKGAEEEAIEVGEDGGATRGDAVLHEEDGELGEEIVDLRGGFEFRELAVEIRGEINGVRFRGGRPGVAEAAGGVGVNNTKAAVAAFGGEVTAAGELGGTGWSVFDVHFLSSIEMIGGVPPMEMQRVRSELMGKELQEINGAGECASE